ncbi:hypothetical protein B0T10DRAFT_544767 [Thelonectria olida]|uniref:BZIP domain-containing protein n=1 Tax=Thelonectria olida TaxID=1576542 RepID=A0A9P9AXM7_9HYPO|nr:hypothetical protein B0T10DRAFT_544767 [Thelonectria olida]
MPQLNSVTQVPRHHVADSDAAERKQRKKLQNRINQRARRVRLKGGDSSDSKQNQRPYQIQISRWRLDEARVAPSTTRLHARKTAREDQAHNPTTSSSDDVDASLLPTSDQQLCTVDVEIYGKRLVSISREWPPSSPLSDHLLHLVNFNAFRGFFANKYLLSQLTKHFIPTPGRTEVVDIMKSFPAQTVVIPWAENIPSCLTPTQLQKKTVHATWIDLIPFPKMRDNLISQHGRFHHWEFMEDVIGDLLNKLMFPVRGIGASSEGYSQLNSRDGLDDELTANRKGLILWGEPFRPDSWEATPGFLTKWNWVVVGCDELLESTNRWRMLRGEDPIQLST